MLAAKLHEFYALNAPEPGAAKAAVARRKPKGRAV